MDKILATLFAAFCFFFLDGISIDKIFRGYTTLIVLYALILAFFVVIEIRNKGFKVKQTLNLKLFGIIAGLYFFNIFRLSDEVDVGIRIIAFLFIAFANAYFIRKYSMTLRYLVIFYFVSFAFVFKQFSDAGFPMDAYQRLSSIFEQDRGRVVFGFYHVNAAGNLGSCLILVSFLIIGILKEKYYGKKVNIAMAAIFGMDFVIISYLLATGSRTAILSIILWVTIYMYYKLSLLNNIGRGQTKYRVLFRFVTIVIVFFVVIESLLETAVSLFVTSNRLRNFIRNLPLLDSPLKKIFGLGVLSPGSVSVYDAVDNYYLYILLTLGIIGLIVIACCLITIGIKLHRRVIETENKLYAMVFAVYACQIISGLSENCILYYIFPSSLIYFLLYFVFLDENYNIGIDKVNLQ